MSETQQQPAAKTSLELVTEKTVSLQDIILKNYPIYSERARKCIMLLKSLPAEITSDEIYALYNDALVKVRATHGVVEAERKECTEPMDENKKFLMIPEKMISNDPAAKDSFYNLAKAKCNAYAQKKLDEQKEREAKAEAERKQGIEINRIRGAFYTSVIDGKAAILQQTTNALNKWLNEASLEGFTELEAKVSALDPKLKPEIWASWFSIGYDTKLVVAEVFNGLLLEAQNNHPFEMCNTDFTEAAAIEKQRIQDDLPIKKKQLTDIAELQKKDAQAAEELRQKNETEALKKQQEDADALLKKQEEDKQQIAQAEQDANMNTEFDSQAALQEHKEVTGIRVAKKGVFDCPEEEMIKVYCEAIFFAFSHLEYKGFYERERGNKLIKLDDDGNPILRKEVADVLNFAATYSAEPIEGLQVVDVVSTVAKAKK